MSLAGKLRHRMRFEALELVEDSNGSVQDENGALRREWTPVVTKWVAIEPLSAREYIAGGGQQGEVTCRITCRYDSRITRKLRGIHEVDGVDGDIYALTDPLPDRDSGIDYMTIPARRGATAGEG